MSFNYSLFNQNSIHIYPWSKLTYHHLLRYKTTTSLNYSWCFGSISGLFIALQIVSGLFLSVHYIATPAEAFLSIQYIIRDVPFG